MFISVTSPKTTNAEWRIFSLHSSARPPTYRIFLLAISLLTDVLLEDIVYSYKAYTVKPPNTVPPQYRANLLSPERHGIGGFYCTFFIIRKLKFSNKIRLNLAGINYWSYLFSYIYLNFFINVCMIVNKFGILNL